MQKEAQAPQSLRYPFPSALNPHADRLEKKVVDWLSNHYAFLPEKVKAKYRKTAIAQAAGCMFPRANRMQLTAICRFYIWAFTIDDCFEFTSAEHIQQIQAKAISVLRNGQPTEELLYQPLLELRKELLAMGSAKWLDRFCRSLGLYFEGVKQEIPYRRQLVFPSLEDYIVIREKAANVHTLVDLAQVITGKALPSGVLEHPILQRLVQLSARVMAWTNDYVSAHLEKGNDVLNLVLIIQHERQCTLQEAYKLAMELHDQDVAAFCLLRNALPDFGIYSLPIANYVENLALMMHGHLYWINTFTARYGGQGHPAEELRKEQGINV